ncbi:hypothetical protein V9T40_008906 [Parthenolecanium corni]|uniref:Ig-like domain-containing protein n=1 Tax=Parthenolecanium corni TaxID=536013 RepID=A0AAN9TRJ6_9HEMI
MLLLWFMTPLYYQSKTCLSNGAQLIEHGRGEPIQSNGGICEMKICLSEQRSLRVKGILLRTTTTNRPVNSLRVLFRFLVTMCCILGHSATICPSVCDCKWKDGKESVICVNTNLTRVPERLDSSVLVLHLHGNSLLTLRNDIFQSAGLLNLQKLYLVRCAIKYIEPHAFRALKNLVDLDLSYNVFSVVPSLALQPIPDLRELKLNGNPILQIPGFAFTNVGQLIRLEVADCRIGYIDEHAFSGLEHSLESLKLSRNRLVNVQPEAFRRLEALNGLDLSDNPLNCSCVLQPLRDWMLRRSLSTNALPMCQSPEHNQNKSWDKLQNDDFACLPSAHAAVKTINAYVGENVTLTCKIGGTPTPDVRWSLRNRVLLNSTFGYPITNKRPYLIHALSNNYSNLTILSLEMQDTGQYVCIAENKAGKVIAEIGLTIEKAPMGAILSERVVLIGILLVTVSE